MHCGGVMSYKCTLWLLVSLLTLVELQSHLCWLKNWLTDAIRPIFSIPIDFQWCWLLGRSRETRTVIRFRQEEAGVPSQNNNAETLYHIISQLKLEATFIFQEERWGDEDAKTLKNTTLLRELPRMRGHTPPHFDFLGYESQCVLHDLPVRAALHLQPKQMQILQMNETCELVLSTCRSQKRTLLFFQNCWP